MMKAKKQKLSIRQALNLLKKGKGQLLIKTHVKNKKQRNKCYLQLSLFAFMQVFNDKYLLEPE